MADCRTVQVSPGTSESPSLSFPAYHSLVFRESCIFFLVVFFCDLFSLFLRFCFFRLLSTFIVSVLAAPDLLLLLRILPQYSLPSIARSSRCYCAWKCHLFELKYWRLKLEMSKNFGEEATANGSFVVTVIISKSSCQTLLFIGSYGEPLRRTDQPMRQGAVWMCC